MRAHFGWIAGAMIVAALLVAAGVASPGADKDADNVRIVTVGQIRKLDLKKRTFQFSIKLDTGPMRGGFGGRGGRGRRGPGRYPRGGGEIQLNPTIEIKVFTSEKTLFKTRGKTIDFSNLRVTDQVSLTGIHKGSGSDVEAIEIDKLPGS